jgi:hypothetical protein
VLFRSPKFTSSTTIGNSAITDDGTTVTLVGRALSGTSATFTGSVTSDDLILTAGTLFGVGNTGFSNRLSDTTLYLQMPATGFNITDNALNTRFILSSTGAATFSSSVTAKSSITVSNNGGENPILSVVSAFADGYRATLRIWNQHTGGKAWEVYSTNDSDGVYGGGKLAFVNSTNSVNAMTITSGGNVLIGTTTDTGQKLQVNGTATFSGNISIGSSIAMAGTSVTGTYLDARVQSAVTGNMVGYQVRMVGLSPTSGTYTIANMYAIKTETPVVQSNVTVTNSYGVYIGRTDDGVSGGIVTNKYALVTEATAGNVGIGTTSPSFRLVIFDVAFIGTANSFVANTYESGFYNTSTGGSNTYPFNANGNLVIQPRTSFTSDIVLATVANSGVSTTPTAKMVIKGSGNVGIGTASPRTAATGGHPTLDIKGGIYFGSTGSESTCINNDDSMIFNIDADNDASGSNFFRFATNTKLETGGTELLRITDVGLVAVGGINSTLIDFDGGTTARFYGGSATNTFGLGAGSTIYYQGDASQFYPTVDNARSIGVSTNRYVNVWATSGVVSTSDEREKTEIVTSDLGLDFITRLRPVSYKWKVGQNIETTEITTDEEGNEQINTTITPRTGIRTHYGLIAQEVKELLGNKDFGGFIHDKESDIMGLRYDQFISPLIKAIQELKSENDNLKSRLEVIEQS